MGAHRGQEGDALDEYEVIGLDGCLVRTMDDEKNKVCPLPPPLPAGVVVRARLGSAQLTKWCGGVWCVSSWCNGAMVIS
jgi:hypothetical protein